MKKHILVIKEQGQELHTLVSTPLSPERWISEEISPSMVKELTDIEIRRGNGELMIVIPIDIREQNKLLYVDEKKYMNQLKKETIKKVREGKYKKYMVNDAMACFAEGGKANHVFKIIREHKIITKGELTHMVKGYTNIEGTIRALHKLINVVELQGQGRTMKIKYIGN